MCVPISCRGVCRIRSTSDGAKWSGSSASSSPDGLGVRIEPGIGVGRAQRGAGRFQFVSRAGEEEPHRRPRRRHVVGSEEVQRPLDGRRERQGGRPGTARRPVRDRARPSAARNRARGRARRGGYGETGRSAHAGIGLRRDAGQRERAADARAAAAVNIVPASNNRKKSGKHEHALPRHQPEVRSGSSRARPRRAARIRAAKRSTRSRRHTFSTARNSRRRNHSSPHINSSSSAEKSEATLCASQRNGRKSVFISANGMPAGPTSTPSIELPP